MTRRTASTRRRRDPDAGTGKGANGNRGRPRVVVVGGGFAGLSTVRELGGADVDVLLLDRDLYNTFQPLLYQVATGGLNPGDVTYALRAFAARYPNGQFRRMAVSGVDAERRCVRTDTGEEIGYDYLVLCCGVTANYFGIPGAQEHARTVYTRKAAIEVRDRMLGNLEAYAQGRPKAVEPVVVIVGGRSDRGRDGRHPGRAAQHRPAGDLSGARSGARPGGPGRDDRPGPWPVRAPPAQVHRQRAAQAGRGAAAGHPRQGGPPGRRRAQRRRPPALGRDRLGHRGEGARPGRRLGAAPGARRPHPGGAGPAGGRAPGDLRRGGRRRLGGRRPAPAGAARHPGGRHAAAQIRQLLAGRPTEPMVDKDKGTMATIGRSAAVVQLPRGVKLKGRVAWLAWVGLHIVMLVGHRNRLATLAHLSVRYLAWPGRLNVIVGDPP